jgi:hypothetical protein
MPVHFDLDREAHLVRTRASGTLAAGEMLELIEAHRLLFADGTLDAGWAEIGDFSAVDDLRDITPGSIARFCDANPWPAAALRALIAPTDLLYDLGRMYRSQGGERTANVQIVRSAAEALDWIIGRRAARGEHA